MEEFKKWELAKRKTLKLGSGKMWHTYFEQLLLSATVGNTLYVNFHTLMTNMIFFEIIINDIILCRSQSNSDSETEAVGETIGEDKIEASEELDKETRTNFIRRKRRKTTSNS